MKVLIYGAYGYTAGLIIEGLIGNEIQLTLAGRHQRKTEQCAKRYGLPYLVFSIDHKVQCVENLKNFDLLVNTAGPFSKTAIPLVEACLEASCHYTDITGEVSVFEDIQKMNKRLEEKNIIALPGIGFDVVPTDYLALALKEKVPDAKELKIAFLPSGYVSPGTLKTMTEFMGKGSTIRRNGTLLENVKNIPLLKLRVNKKMKFFISIPWGDASTAYYTTGIPNIKIYLGAHIVQIFFIKLSYILQFILQNFLVRYAVSSLSQLIARGPGRTQRQKFNTFIWGQVKNTHKSQEATLVVPEGYETTAITACGIIKEIMNNSEKFSGGFHTPAQMLGINKISKFDGFQSIQFPPAGESLELRET